MTIVAKFRGMCKKCGHSIEVGQEINWEKGSGSEHVKCPSVVSAASRPATGISSSQVTHGGNHQVGYCERCGEFLAAGEGRLQYCVEDSGCPKHHDYAGYHLYCSDAASCNTRSKEARKLAADRKAEAERKVSEQREREAAWATQVANLTEGLEVTGCGPRLFADGVRKGELIASAPEGVQSAAYHFVIDEVRRIDGEIVTVNYHDWIVRRCVSPARARELRLAWAEESGTTVDDARKARDGGYPYLGVDQRKMYEAVLIQAGEEI